MVFMTVTLAMAIIRNVVLLVILYTVKIYLQLRGHFMYGLAYVAKGSGRRSEKAVSSVFILQRRIKGKKQKAVQY